MQNRYGFKAHAFHAAGVDSKEDYNAKFGSDLFLTVSKQIALCSSCIVGDRYLLASTIEGVTFCAQWRVLWVQDIEEYDRICKVEPFSRSLKTLEVGSNPEHQIVPKLSVTLFTKKWNRICVEDHCMKWSFLSVCRLMLWSMEGGVIMVQKGHILRYIKTPRNTNGVFESEVTGWS